MKRIILICSLFSVVGISALDTRPFDPQDPAYTPSLGLLDKELQKTVRSFEQNQEVWLNAREALLQTEEGKAYENASSDYYECDEESPLREDLCKVRELA